jgi:hypothetical protein
MLRAVIATAALLGLGTTAARAEVVGTIPIGLPGVRGYLPNGAACGHTFTWKLRMEAGKFYVLRAYFDRYGTATLRGTNGVKIASFDVFPTDDDYFNGREAKAPSTGTYLLEVTSSPDPHGGSCEGDGEGYRLSYLPDCPGGRGTPCALPAGTTRSGSVDLLREWDWWKTTLKAGKRYDVALDGCVGQLVIRDAKGRPVATSNYCDEDSNVQTPPAISGFRPRAGGTYYVDVEGVLCPQCGDLARYAVSLKAR